MIWKKAIYDSLTSCATTCDTFARECYRPGNGALRHHSVYSILDCADACRQLGALYGRGSKSTRLMATVCIDRCEACIDELSRLDSVGSRRVQAACRRTIQSCVSLLNMARQTDTAGAYAVSLYWDLPLRLSLYN